MLIYPSRLVPALNIPLAKKIRAAGGVIPIESLGKGLHRHTSSHESIEIDARGRPTNGYRTRGYRTVTLLGRRIERPRALTILMLYQSEDTRTQVVAKASQSFAQLSSIDITRIIAIKVLENTLPFGDVFPESSELF
jgi:hypothetical protein